VAAPNIITASSATFNHIVVLSLPLTPVAVAANTTAEQSFTVTGLQVSDGFVPRDQIIAAAHPTAQVGLVISSQRVSAADTLTLAFTNGTAGSLTPTAELYQITIFRPNAPITSTIGANL
jgi:hypothetical protein